MDLTTLQTNYQKSSENILNPKKTTLEDKDYLLIEALLKLDTTLNKLARKE